MDAPDEALEAQVHAVTPEGILQPDCRPAVTPLFDTATGAAEVLLHSVDSGVTLQLAGVLAAIPLLEISTGAVAVRVHAATLRGMLQLVGRLTATPLLGHTPRLVAVLLHTFALDDLVESMHGQPLLPALWIAPPDVPLQRLRDGSEVAPDIIGMLAVALLLEAPSRHGQLLELKVVFAGVCS